MYAVKATGTLRVSREGELEGLDLHEHGMVAYPGVRHSRLWSAAFRAEHRGCHTARSPRSDRSRPDDWGIPGVMFARAVRSRPGCPPVRSCGCAASSAAWCGCDRGWRLRAGRGRRFRRRAAPGQACLRGESIRFPRSAPRTSRGPIPGRIAAADRRSRARRGSYVTPAETTIARLAVRSVHNLPGHSGNPPPDRVAPRTPVRRPWGLAQSI